MLQSLPVPPRNFHTICIDTVGKITPSGGFSYILTCMCELSSFLIAKPVKKQNALTVTMFLLQDVFLRFGFPHVIRSDRGSEFLNHLIEQLLNMLHIKHLKSSGWRPQTTGVVERSHRTIGSLLSKVSADDQKDWSSCLP